MLPPVIYTAQSKQFFYCRDAVCQFVFERGRIPINPFRAFDYFLGDRVNRDLVRMANYAMLKRSDELWVFGTTIADGVLVEIAQAVDMGKPVHYFTIQTCATEITEVTASKLDFEREVYDTTNLERPELLGYLEQGKTLEFANALGRVNEVCVRA